MSNDVPHRASFTSPYASYYGDEPLSPRAQREEAIIARWKRDRTFQQSLDLPSPQGEFVFYEGPPTANGRPGIHHLISRAFKDLIPRYKTMRGYHVRRKAGWDTHGLPVEVEVEKKLGLRSKRDIESFGVARFNALCRESVWEYAREWEHFTERIGYWIDLERAYVTYHPEYIESLWWIIRQLHERNLLYRDYKVVPWCPRCGTPLSSHELAQEYREVEDWALTVRFALEDAADEYVLAWTTTPWTLPANVALVVHPELTYARVRTDEGAYWVARERVPALFGAEAHVEHEAPGATLVGRRYRPLWPGVATRWDPDARERAFRVYAADFVSAEEGTGIVHTAVMYGAEDFEVGTAERLPRDHLVDEEGRFVADAALGALQGRSVKDEETIKLIRTYLHERGALWKEERIVHAYPHCWRCKERVLYYAHSSWFIKMSALRDELIRENLDINWVPPHLREGRFGEWLAHVRDWAVSRNRFWATPLPVWESEDGKKRLVVDSIATLRAHTPSRGNHFWFMRHGEARSNADGIIDDGHDDADGLTDAGHAAVRRSAELLKDAGITVIYTSPLRRARETAEVVRETLGLPADAVRVDERLAEPSYGPYNGMQVAAFLQLLGEGYNRFHHPPEGVEGWESVRRRITEALFAIDSAHEGARILVISHRVPLTLLEGAWEARSAAWVVRSYADLPRYETAEVREKGVFHRYPVNEAWEVDLHRPYVDEWELRAEDGTPLRRVEEVLDVWFDSGAMPLAQDHYPFENRSWVDGPGYPADFICEGIDQTRGWFYTLHALGVALGRGKAYRTVVSVGHLLDREGRKMSKSLGNIVDPWRMAARYGVDVMRLYMYSVNHPGDAKHFDERHLKELERGHFNLLENVVRFYSLYRHPADEEGGADEERGGRLMDRWLRARIAHLEEVVRTHLDAYEIYEASRALIAFVEDLSRWYVRRSRGVFRGSESEEAHRAASRTLREVLEVFARITAPFTPFTAEWVYEHTRLSNAPESVHLSRWPEQDVMSWREESLLRRMDAARAIVSSGLEARARAGVRVRQPLARLVVRDDPAGVVQDPAFRKEIADEVNVQEVVVDATAPEAVVLDTTVTPELRVLGWEREVVRAIQEARKRAGLSPDERAEVEVVVAPEVAEALAASHERLTRATRSTKIVFQVEGGVNEVGEAMVRRIS